MNLYQWVVACGWFALAVALLSGLLSNFSSLSHRRGEAFAKRLALALRILVVLPASLAISAAISIYSVGEISPLATALAGLFMFILISNRVNEYVVIAPFEKDKINKSISKWEQKNRKTVANWKGKKSIS